MLENTSVRKNDLSHTSLKCSTIPLRHGSRSGMNLGVTPRSRQVATIGLKCCPGGPQVASLGSGEGCSHRSGPWGG